MTQVTRSILGAVLVGAMTAATAVPLDGSVPLLCSVTGSVSCQSAFNCESGTPDTVNLPSFLEFDLANNVAKSARASGEERTSKVQHEQREDGTLSLIGVDQGAGWSATIDESDGKMVLSVSRSGAGFIAFGVCIPK
jgi:hypothetical protein